MSIAGSLINRRSFVCGPTCRITIPVTCRGTGIYTLKLDHSISALANIVAHGGGTQTYTSGTQGQYDSYPPTIEYIYAGGDISNGWKGGQFHVSMTAGMPGAGKPSAVWEPTVANKTINAKGQQSAAYEAEDYFGPLSFVSADCFLCARCGGRRPDCASPGGRSPCRLGTGLRNLRCPFRSKRAPYWSKWALFRDCWRPGSPRLTPSFGLPPNNRRQSGPMGAQHNHREDEEKSPFLH
ncbi:hypothetical protein BCR34DRAFT_584192 [Clohesyomyces aquaticus]|uniref:Uncharacterized protein n=1 Tax=Clohesyomyces aquaticus TaxID=1231657 RepID=A0A1Y2A2U9_9PLEO|nr:hypothetical protein BCR34DRAFT_584192 [Clohesyomyces aquaticus]